MAQVDEPTALTMTESREFTQRSSSESSADDCLFDLARALLPKFGPFWNSHQTLLLKRQSLSRLIYYYELYKLIVDVPGVICEFGVQWGSTMSTLINLRGMFEPYNHSRHIFGFDTFEGFATVTDQDGGYSNVGDYATEQGFEETLEQVLALQESFSPLSHIRKFQLIKGDASKTIYSWLEQNKHAIISMAILDMDVYQPTRDVLEAILPRLTKGSVLVFDELVAPNWPGETIAVQEVLGLSRLRLRRHPHQPHCAYAVFEG